MKTENKNRKGVMILLISLIPSMIIIFNLIKNG